MKPVRFHIPTTERELIVEGVLLLKLLIMVGILASYFLPPTHAALVAGATNLLWLWKL